MARSDCTAASLATAGYSSSPAPGCSTPVCPTAPEWCCATERSLWCQCCGEQLGCTTSIRGRGHRALARAGAGSRNSHGTGMHHAGTASSVYTKCIASRWDGGLSLIIVSSSTVLAQHQLLALHLQQSLLMVDTGHTLRVQSRMRQQQDSDNQMRAPACNV